MAPATACKVRAMKLLELVEGESFHTKATNRVGVVMRHTDDLGTLVRWEDGKMPRYLHPEIEVDELVEED